MSGSTLTYTTKIINASITVVEVSGEIDLNNSGKLRNHFKQLRQAGAAQFIFDFGKTEYMDSSGVGLLVFIFTSSRQRNIRVCFADFTPAVWRLLCMTRLNTVLPVADRLDQAIEAMKTGGCRDIQVKRILVDGKSPLFTREGMEYLELRLQLSQVRRLSLLIAQKAPPDTRGINLLEQQISELLKNAVKHGNRCDPEKKVRIWYSFSSGCARLIVEDEGAGFNKVEEWNDFYRHKMILHSQQDYERLFDYLSFRTQESDEADGGNALFAAVEYWNQGVVFNDRRTAVAVKKNFYH
jgi:serine/threonine-protein kinase RsbW